MNQRFELTDNEKSKLIGTTFDEDEQSKKQHFYNLEGKDKKNHKRWTGAFSGGFTAGYNNTVGSKNGWKPTSFISSQDAPAKFKETRIEDILDDDELMEWKTEQLQKSKNKTKTQSPKIEPEDAGNLNKIGELILNNVIELNYDSFIKSETKQIWSKKNNSGSMNDDNIGKKETPPGNVFIKKRQETNLLPPRLFIGDVKTSHQPTAYDQISDLNRQNMNENNKNQSGMKSDNIITSTNLIEGNDVMLDDDSEPVLVPHDYDFYYPNKNEQENKLNHKVEDFIEIQKKFKVKYDVMTGNKFSLDKKFVMANDKSISTQKEAVPDKNNLRERKSEEWKVPEELANKFGYTTYQ